MRGNVGPSFRRAPGRVVPFFSLSHVPFLLSYGGPRPWPFFLVEISMHASCMTSVPQLASTLRCIALASMCTGRLLGTFYQVPKYMLHVHMRCFVRSGCLLWCWLVHHVAVWAFRRHPDRTPSLYYLKKTEGSVVCLPAVVRFVASSRSARPLRRSTPVLLHPRLRSLYSARPNFSSMMILSHINAEHDLLRRGFIQSRLESRGNQLAFVTNRPIQIPVDMLCLLLSPI